MNNGTTKSKLREFEILFDDPKAVFTSGDEIRGKIRIFLNEPMKMRMVQMRFTGITKVALADPKQLLISRQSSKKETGNNEHQLQQQQQPKEKEKNQKKEKKKKKEQSSQDVQGVIVGKNGVVAVAVPTNGNVQNGAVVAQTPNPTDGKYHEMISLDKTIDLLERRPGQELPHDFILPSGLNTLPFTFLLPKKPLPASFESTHASVRYVCQATICKPWKHDYTTKKAFTVLPPSDDLCPFDPNSSEAVAATSGYCCRLATPANFPTLSNRLSVDETTSTQACCATGRVSCEASLQKQVFNLGESTSITAKVINNSRLAVEEIKFALVQQITCKGRDNGGKVERTSVYTRNIWSDTKMITNDKKSKKNKQERKKQAAAAEFFVNFRIPTVSPSMEIDSNVYNHYKAGDQSSLDRRILGGLMMLRVSYYASVQLKVGKKVDYLTVKLPLILIGAPFVTFSQQEYDHKSRSDSFELSECALGSVDIRDETDGDFVTGSQKFAPYYPILRIDTSSISQVAAA
uniref:Arrestin C-terminal-like domain-containing protein n=1 Tax=Romanomermis culicivorax TaxID=13658 RepID=A0A915HZA0_ROMCU